MGSWTIAILLGAVGLLIAALITWQQRGAVLSSEVAAPEADVQRSSGRELMVRCQACHGLDGAGVANLYPSLRVSAKLANGDPTAAIAVVLRGVPPSRPGVPAMPSFALLSDAEIAAVLSWMRQSWISADATPIAAEQVARVRGAR